MARVLRTGSKAAKARARKKSAPRSRKSAKTKRGIASSVTAHQAPSVADLRAQLEHRTTELDRALERLTATADILKVIANSPSDVQPVFEAIAECAARLCKAEFCNVFRFDGELIHFMHSYGYSREAIEHLRQFYPMRPGRGSCAGRAILNGKVEQIPEVRTDPEYAQGNVPDIMKISSIIAVPMLKEHRPVGAIALIRPTKGTFPQRQIDLLKTFADQAVIAIENARLFEQVQARTRELTQSLEDLRTAQGRLIQTEKLASLGQLTAGIAHEIKNPLNFVNNFAALSAELTDELDETLASAPLDRKMLGDIVELTQMLKSNLEKVVQHGKRADSIVKNMLQHSREGSGEHCPVDINAIVDESLNLAYHGARAEKADFTIALQRDFDPSVGMADVYPQEVTRVLLNILSNGFYAATKRKAEAGDGFEAMLSATTAISSKRYWPPS